MSVDRGGRPAIKIWGARVPIAMIVVAAVALVSVAVTGVANQLPGMTFAQSGHWVYNSALRTVFHLDGPTKRVDAEAPIQADPGSQVVQGDTGGYVIGSSKITEFGKSSLAVEGVTAAPVDERPVPLEVRGGPYLIYRQAGIVVRLGKKPVTIPAGGKLTDPVATGDGTLWLHRVDSGLLCELPPGADRLTCNLVLPDRHTGALTTVAGHPVFLDASDDTLRPVGPTAMGEPVALGVDLPPTVLAASTDVAGKVAVLDPQGFRLHLLDAAAKAKPVTVELPKGEYAAIASTGSVVAVVDRTTDTLRTFRADGETKDTKGIPGGDGSIPLVKGEDEQVYVDGADGAHVLVVDSGGGVSQVPAVGGGKKPDESQPAPPPVEPPPPPAETKKPDSQAGSEPPPSREPKRTPAKPPPPAKTITEPPPAPASPPGAPASVTARAGNASATVDWAPAPPNGAPVTGYRVSWPDGERTVDGAVQSVAIGGLVNGTSYVFTVAATNRAGTGPGASSARVTPQIPTSPPGTPGNLYVRLKVGDTDGRVSWTAAAPNGAPITAYRLTWIRDDGSRAGSITLPGTARTHIIEDIWQGEDVPFTVTVVAVNSAGAGAPASFHKVEGDPPS